MKGENMNNKSLIQNETVFLDEVTELVQKARDTANSAVSSIIVVTGVQTCALPILVMTRKDENEKRRIEG